MSTKMEKSKKVTWIIRIGVLIIFAVVLAKPIYTLIRNQEQWSKKELPDYKNLFDKEAQKNLYLFNTIESKLREPESQYIYNKDYNVFVTKIRIADNFDIKKSIKVRNEDSNIEKDELYFPLRSFNCKIRIKSGNIPLTAKITVNVKGKMPDEINRSNSEVSYYCEFKTFSLIFENGQSYMVAESDKSNVPVSLTFIKKNNLLYIVIMTIAKERQQMQPNLLYSIINK
jgi:hypothetical protein